MLKRTVAYGLNFTYPAGDSAIGQNVARFGEFSPLIAAFLIEHAVEPSGCLIDVGANLGSICLPFALHRPGWRVLAIEASRSIAALLSTNAVSNDLLNVEVVQAAAGGESGLADFPNIGLGESRNYGTLALGGDGPTARTAMLTVDEIAPDDVGLVKIDAEGHDLQVLAGARKVLAQQRAIWIVEADPKYPGSSAPVISTLLAAGYDLYWFFSPWVTPAKVRMVAQISGATFALAGDTNVIALPPGAPNNWGLRRIAHPSETRPGDEAAYPYLERNIEWLLARSR